MAGTRVVGMHLDRQPFVGVEKLEQQRKLFWRGATTEQFAGMLAHQFTQGLAGQRAVCDHALIGAVIDDLPTFGIVAFRAERLSQG